jgi:hypothetical protein
MNVLLLILLMARKGEDNFLVVDKNNFSIWTVVYTFERISITVKNKISILALPPAGICFRVKTLAEDKVIYFVYCYNLGVSKCVRHVRRFDKDEFNFAKTNCQTLGSRFPTQTS